MMNTKRFALLTAIALSTLTTQNTPATSPQVKQPQTTSREPNSMETNKDKIIRVFNGLNKDNVGILKEFYAEDVLFEDPLGQIKGLNDLTEYYVGMYKNVQDIRFDFAEILQEETNFAGVWTMTMTVKNFNGGKPIVVKGMSLMQFNDQQLVTYHRDYFDMGEMIYEKVPVLKYFISLVRKNLEHKPKSEL